MRKSNIFSTRCKPIITNWLGNTIFCDKNGILQHRISNNYKQNYRKSASFNFKETKTLHQVI